MNIGRDSSHPTETARYFDGAIDEVRIYNRALSANEISEHFNASSDAYNTSNTSQNPVVQFSSTSTKEVELQATDADAYSCSCSKEVGGRPPLPKWKEITPF